MMYENEKEINLEKKTLKSLKEMCKEIGLMATGNKNEIVNRLERYFEKVNNSVTERRRGVGLECMSKHVQNESSPVSIAVPFENIASAQAYRTGREFVEQATTTHNVSTFPTYTYCTTSTQATPSYIGHTPQATRVPYCYAKDPAPAPASTTTTSIHTSMSVDSTHFVPRLGELTHLPQTVSSPIDMENAQFRQSSVCGSQVYCVRDIIAILPEFEPCGGNSITSAQFVARINQLKHAYNWDDKALLFAVQTKLKGAAKFWIDSNQVFTSWHEFVESFLRDFPTITNAADIHIEMLGTIRQWNETLEEYYFKMLALGRKGNLPEEAIVKYILNGIHNRDFINAVISHHFATCNDLLGVIKRFQNLNQNTKIVKDSRNQKSNSNRNNNNDNGNNNNVNRPHNNNNLNNNNKVITCFNCNKLGHMSRNCSLPQRKERCSICTRTTHATAQCPEKQTHGRVQQSNTYTIEQNANIPNEIYKTIKVNNADINAFIDPGSDRTLIRKRLAERLGKPESCHLKLRGFGGGAYVCTAKVQLNIEIDGTSHELCALVVDDITLKSDVLLGRDVLCQSNQRLIIQGEDCWLERTENLLVDNDLPQQNLIQLTELLKQYRTCFALNMKELGRCSTVKMEIKLKAKEYVQMKPYRIAFAKREIVEGIIAELLDNEIIRPSTSPFASPIVLTEKKNGEARLCIDYRRLNSLTVRQPYPMPNLEDQFASLAGNKYFTTLDMKMGYHQIEIEENSKQYTGFVTHNAHYEYNRMPFGLVNAPSVFQTVVNKLISQLPSGEVLAYLDDIVIPSSTITTGLRRLEKFLTILHKSGLTLRLDKCRFLAKEIAYLGHVVNEEGIRPGPGKLSAIKNFKEPTNVTEVRRFLGLTGFFRKFIEGYSIIAKPLTELLKQNNNTNFRWEEAEKKAFVELSDKLTKEPVLALYNYNSTHEIHTDASSAGLAGVLLQSEDGNRWKPVCYYSRRCTETEQKFHSYELEVLAVVETLDRFRVYVLGKHIRLVTDCAAISKIKGTTEMIPRVARWWYRLLEYDLDIVHRSGNRLAHVDALSRAPDLSSSNVEPTGLVFQVQTCDEDWLFTIQVQDPSLKRIMSILNDEIKDEQQKQVKQEYMLINNRLYRKDEQGSPKFVVPKAVRWRVVKHMHDDHGHPGVEKTITQLKQYFWFPKIRSYIKKYLDACTVCHYNKTRTGRKEGRLYLCELEPLPFRKLHIDHLGPFIKSKKGNMYIVAVSDAFSKYLVIKAVRNTKALPVINMLSELTTYFGLPKCVVTDRGTAFTGKLFETYCDNHDIQHVKIAVRTPRANGQVERANQTILSFLRSSTTDKRTWDEQLRVVQWSINNQPNSTTRYSPNELIFDFNLRDIVANELLAALQDDTNSDTSSPIDLTSKRTQALANIEKERQRWKQRYDDHHSIPTEYEVGSLVLLESDPVSTGESRKLEPKYRGPYVISKSLGRDRYLIHDLQGLPISNRKASFIYSSEKIRPWCFSSPDLDGLDDSQSDTDSDDEDVCRSGEAELSRTTTPKTSN